MIHSLALKVNIPLVSLPTRNVCRKVLVRSSGNKVSADMTNSRLFGLCVQKSLGHRFYSHSQSSYKGHGTFYNGTSNTRLVLGGAAALTLATLGLASSPELAWFCDTAKPTSKPSVSVTESVETVADPSTSLVFPRTMTVKAPSSGPPKTLTLLGVGVRTVSFLRMKVYVVGFYADLEGVDLKKNALDSEQKIEWLIRNRCVAVRLVPIRNTSYQHLRDAYIRSVQARLAAIRSAPDEIHLTEQEEDAVQTSLQSLKALFPPSALSKHTPLQIILWSPPQTPGGPRSLFIPRLGGQVDDVWVGVELMRGYFQGDGVSPKMKQSVMGSVETL